MNAGRGASASRAAWIGKVHQLSRRRQRRFHVLNSAANLKLTTLVARHAWFFGFERRRRIRAATVRERSPGIGDVSQRLPGGRSAPTCKHRFLTVAALITRKLKRDEALGGYSEAARGRGETSAKRCMTAAERGGSRGALESAAERRKIRAHGASRGGGAALSPVRGGRGFEVSGNEERRGPRRSAPSVLARSRSSYDLRRRSASAPTPNRPSEAGSGITKN